MSSTATTESPAAVSVPVANFGWYELMTTDTAAAGAFYSSVVGWTTKEMGIPGMPYTIFNLDGVGVAGMMDLPPEAGPRPSWIGYVVVTDLEAQIAKVVAAGGKLHKGPIEVPKMLHFAVMSDPQGAAFMMFTPAPMEGTPPKQPEPGTPGTIGWRELMAADGDAALEFYSSQFGWTKGPGHDMGPMGIYQIFEINGVQAGGVMTKPPEVPHPFWNYYFMVDGIKAAAERITAAGGKVCNGPMPVPGGQFIVQAQDPQGGSFCLVSNTE